MTTELDLAQLLFEAQTDGRHDVDATPYSSLDRDAAYRVQTRVLDMLGGTPGMLKTGLHSDGVGVVAPILRSRVGHSGSFELPSANVIGLELEVGLVLGSDLTSDTARADEIDIIEAIDHYFVGIEICGSRYRDRALAGQNGGLADNMSALGYAIDPTPRERGADIHGLDVELNFDGARIYAAPAKHGFGTVLASLVAYARDQHPTYPLKAGTIVTTGSLCGLVPITGTGRVTGQLGNHIVAFDIV